MDKHLTAGEVMQYLNEKFRREVEAFAEKEGISFDEAAKRARISIGGRIIEPFDANFSTYQKEDTEMAEPQMKTWNVEIQIPNLELITDQVIEVNEQRARDRVWVFLKDGKWFDPASVPRSDLAAAVITITEAV